MKKGGFTIVELLIVIAIMGILATIGMVTYSGIQDRARAGKIVENLKNIEDAFSLYAVKERISTWPYENEFGQGTNPSLDNVTANTSLGNYLGKLGPVPGYPNSVYTYDNDPTDPDEAFDNCGQTLDGVNIRITNMAESVALALDKQIDDGNVNCGQVRWLPAYSAIKYILSETRDIK